MYLSEPDWPSLPLLQPPDPVPVAVVYVVQEVGHGQHCLAVRPGPLAGQPHLGAARLMLQSNLRPQPGQLGGATQGRVAAGNV